MAPLGVRHCTVPLECHFQMDLLCFDWLMASVQLLCKDVSWFVTWLTPVWVIAVVQLPCKDVVAAPILFSFWACCMASCIYRRQPLKTTGKTRQQPMAFQENITHHVDPCTHKYLARSTLLMPEQYKCKYNYTTVVSILFTWPYLWRQTLN